MFAQFGFCHGLKHEDVTKHASDSIRGALHKKKNTLFKTFRELYVVFGFIGQPLNRLNDKGVK